jgi:acyl dehydratase
MTSIQDHAGLASVHEYQSGWITVTQEMIDVFGRCTLDTDPFHNDPAWAAENSPYGGTIAFGFLTMGLLTHLINDAYVKAGEPSKPEGGYYLNYGFDRLRLVEPVPAGARVRGRFGPTTAWEDQAGRVRRSIDVVVDIEGVERPALVARWLSVWVPHPADRS